MLSLSHLQKKLDASFGGEVKASFENRILTLSGSVDTWQDAVSAGRMCASPKSYTIVNDICVKDVVIPPMTLPSLRDNALDGKSFDVVIIGGGIIGCSIARELMRYALSVLIVEKEHDVALHASSRNDGMVHPGVDLHRGTLKQAYNTRGNLLYDTVCEELGVEFKRTGQLLGFTHKWVKYVLPLTPIYWRSKGVPCHYISKKKLLIAEPMLTAKVECGLSFPSAGIVCPYNLTIAYAENAVQNGAVLSLDTAVLDMETTNGNILKVHTTRGAVTPRVVINAAGTFSDEVAGMAGDRFFSIHPRKGTNAILDKKAAVQIKTIASLLGTAATKTTHSKGGGLVSTIDGNLLVGPDAVETFEKENFATAKSSVDATFLNQKKALPTLSTADIITYFTGVRAPTYEEDFVICKGRATHNLVHAAGIQSPGLTAAPAIAVDVAKMAVELLGGVRKNAKFNPVRKPIPRVANLDFEARDLLIRQNPDYGVIVCRCEEVSRGEILDAMHRCVPCDTVDGIKRRVRPGMGRCQGGFCGPLVASLIAQDQNVPLDQVLKSGLTSPLLCGATKHGGAGDEN